MISLDDYDYILPDELIAKDPAHPRESARLFVYDTSSDEIFFDTFANIREYLPKNSLLVFNNTRVIPARLWLKKPTGGKIQVLLSMNEYRPGDEFVKGVVDRKIEIGIKLSFKSGANLEVVKQEEQYFFFKPSISIDDLWKLLDDEGVTPIPPYIKGSSLDEQKLREEYQTVFAKALDGAGASVAAPTASLHFSSELLDRLSHEGVWRAEVTLHVGSGTFAPISENNFENKKLFTEYWSIDEGEANKINLAKREGVSVIPVGTTALRTIESAATLASTKENGEPSYEVSSASGKPTDIFIFPPYKFKMADALITNFHVPRSSLMLLVDAMLKAKGAKRDIKELYEIAKKEGFRFYSFGDGMLIR
jgi:S-adenosylmethionine:tRNA ribosyltransferase-isomerase